MKNDGITSSLADLISACGYLERSQLTEDDILSAHKLVKAAAKRLKAIHDLVSEGIFQAAPEPVSGPQHPALFEEEEA